MNVRKQDLFNCYFTTILRGWPGGWVGGWLEELKIRLTCFKQNRNYQLELSFAIYSVLSIARLYSILVQIYSYYPTDHNHQTSSVKRYIFFWFYYCVHHLQHISRKTKIIHSLNFMVFLSKNRTKIFFTSW